MLFGRESERDFLCVRKGALVLKRCLMKALRPIIGAVPIAADHL